MCKFDVYPDYIDTIAFVHRPMYYTRGYHSGEWLGKEEPISIIIDKIQTGKREELRNQSSTRKIINTSYLSIMAL